MSRKVLGLEIREDSVAAVLLDTGFKGCELEAQGFYPIDSGNSDDEGLKNALKTMIGELKPTGAACAVGIPTNFVSFRNISVPFHDTKKIRQVLPFELEPTLPIPVEELVFDFEGVKREGNQDLLAFAIPKEKIQWYLDMLGSVSLRPTMITPGGYAAARFIATMTSDVEDFLLIDTGEGNHTVYAVCAGIVRLVRSFPVAGNGVPVLRHLETTMGRTFTALQETQGIDVKPVSVFSTGPQSGLLDDGGKEVSLLNLPVTSIEAIRTFPRLQKQPDSLGWQSGRFDTALSLALMEAEAIGGINFSSEQSTIAHFASEYRGKIITSAVFIILSISIILAGQTLAINGKKRKLGDLDRQIESVFKQTFPEVTRIVNPLQQMQIKIRETGENSIHPDMPGARVRVIDILKAFSSRIPKSVDVTIHRMVVAIDNVVLSGNTDTFNTVDDIKGRLEKDTIFTGVTISSADLEKSGKRVRFKLKLDF